MKHTLIKNEGGKSLLILFLGWSCDPESVKSFTPKDWDLLLLYDYNDIQFPVEALAIMTEYEKFALAAHSFGVWVANHHLSKFPTMTTTIAICGTLFPVDDKFGIPQRVFDLTLRSIQKEGIGKFNERMGGNVTPSQTPFDEQYNALVTLGAAFTNYPATADDVKNWKVAVICMNDQIIPVDNQVAFWGESEAEVIGFKSLPHFPFSANFSQFISSIL